MKAHKAELPKASPPIVFERHSSVKGKSYPVYGQPYVDVLADLLLKDGVHETEIERMKRAYKKSAPDGLQKFAALKQKARKNANATIHQHR